MKSRFNFQCFWFDQILLYFITKIQIHHIVWKLRKKCHFYKSIKSGLQLIRFCERSRISIECNCSKLWLKIGPFGKSQTFSLMLSCKACWPMHWELAWQLYCNDHIEVGLGFWSRSSLWCCWCMQTCRCPCCRRKRHFQLCRCSLWKPQFHASKD